jgi:hypothetical protein
MRTKTRHDELAQAAEELGLPAPAPFKSASGAPIQLAPAIVEQQQRETQREAAAGAEAAGEGAPRPPTGWRAAQWAISRRFGAFLPVTKPVSPELTAASPKCITKSLGTGFDLSGSVTNIAVSPTTGSSTVVFKKQPYNPNSPAKTKNPRTLKP